MASTAPPPELPLVPMGGAAPAGAALQHRPWRKRLDLSSGLARLENVLESAGFDRAPWLVVSMATGIAAWFVLGNRWHWLALLALCGAGVLAGLAAFGREGRFPYLRQALIAVPGLIAVGCLLVWGKSALAGTEPIARPLIAEFTAQILSREEQPADERVRLILLTREPETTRALRVRVNLPIEHDNPAITPGAQVRLRARLMPPAPPMLPGSYDFARAAWFSGLAATGSVLGEVEVLAPGRGGGVLARTQTALARHVRTELGGSAGCMSVR